jgi:hypothetical protein
MAFHAREECITAYLLTCVMREFLRDRNVGFAVDGISESENEKDPLVLPRPNYLQAARFHMFHPSSPVARPGSDDSDSEEEEETELAPNQIANQTAEEDQKEPETYQGLQAELFGKPVDDILTYRLRGNPYDRREARFAQMTNDLEMKDDFARIFHKWITARVGKLPVARWLSEPDHLIWRNAHLTEKW